MTPLEKILWRAKPVDSIPQDEIAAARAELTALHADRDRLNALEKEMKEDPIMLHNCGDRSEWPKYPRGLGLLKGQRNLRHALDVLRGTEKPAPPIAP